MGSFTTTGRRPWGGKKRKEIATRENLGFDNRQIAPPGWVKGHNSGGAKETTVRRGKKKGRFHSRKKRKFNRGVQTTDKIT